jgi:DNA-binding CsgD family transcriptional regulator
MTFGSDAAYSPASSNDMKLTNREYSIVRLIAGGRTNLQIAKELRISRHTVAQHIAQMLRRIDVHSRSELVAWVYSVGILRTGVWPPHQAEPTR